MMEDRLKMARKQKHMSQEELAELIDVTPTSISSYERGKTTPTSFILKCLCEVLEVSADWVLGLKDYDVIIGEKDS